MSNGDKPTNECWADKRHSEIRGVVTAPNCHFHTELRRPVPVRRRRLPQWKRDRCVTSRTLRACPDEAFTRWKGSRSNTSTRNELARSTGYWTYIHIMYWTQQWRSSISNHAALARKMGESRARSLHAFYARLRKRASASGRDICSSSILGTRECQRASALAR
ncbi:hypothetical protein EVAR_17702_1 [Eumeta japonica]|uniref:Uncharacterized protein n=1 Tax=Eumeta variegata TaxID=151549 RepID=A0A4C1UTL4_EUMVA|nr:hypothetical protein EVAR_17702_1 [Eumeta japonica]